MLLWLVLGGHDPLVDVYFGGIDLDFPLENLKQQTRDFLAGRATEVKPSLRQVTKQVAHYFRLKIADLTGPSRRQAPVRARGIAMYLARELTGASFQTIGRQFDRRDHTTVLHACRRTEELIQTEPEIKQAVEELIERFHGN